MGRRNRKHRNKNKKNNKSNTVSGAESVRFLKRDGDVGLFISKDDVKFRAHKAHIYGNLKFLKKGACIAVKSLYLIPVMNKRIVVTNCPSWFLNETPRVVEDLPKEVPYIYGSTLHVVDNNYSAARFKLPVGTQYHWISFLEPPKLGDYVMGSLSSNEAQVKGYVTNVDAELGRCTVNGKDCSILDIGYRITNPEFIGSVVAGQAVAEA